MKLFRWFKRSPVVEVDISNALSEGFKRIQEEALIQVNSLKTELLRVKYDLSNKQRLIEEQRLKLREQNEADILFTCKMIEKEILAGKNKEEVNPLYQHLAGLQNQTAQMRQGYGTTAFSGLGTIGLFR